MYKLYGKILKVCLVCCLLGSVCFAASYAAPAALNANVQRRVVAAQTTATPHQIVAKGKNTQALYVQIEVRQPDGSVRQVNNPGVVIGARHMMVYLGPLAAGERIKHITVEQEVTVLSFAGTFNNAWYDEEELYATFARFHAAQWESVILLLNLPYDVSNPAVAVVGMENTDSAKRNFEREISSLVARWVNPLARWDTLISAKLQTIAFEAATPQYTTKRVGTVHYVGEPLFATFAVGNSLGIPAYQRALVGFKKPGWSTFGGFSEFHINVGKILAPEVKFYKF